MGGSNIFGGLTSALGRACWLAPVCYLLAACAEADSGVTSEGSAAGGPAYDIEIRRSLVVTEEPILARFPLQRVMDQLALQSEIEGATGIGLFRQWWDTQNPGPGLALGPHCDDQLDPATGRPSINGFPYDCRPPPAEGAQAACASFADPICDYIPIGLFNRFDLAPPDGAHCGEYRIVYAKRSGQVDPFDRNLIIFEAALLNPFPEMGLAGCAPLVQVWAGLSKQQSLVARAVQLERFYFEGTGKFLPAVHVQNFGDNPLGVGQVRSNQFMGQAATRVWTLRDYKLARVCTDVCRLAFTPVTVKNNPPGVLFGAPASEPRALPFQAHFVQDSVASLSAFELSDIAMLTPEPFNAAQSHTSRSDEMRYGLYFGGGDGSFAAAIQSALNLGVTELTPDEVVARALTQTCAGCHQLSNGAALGGGKSWPSSLGFVHVTEREPEVYQGEQRFRLSAALLDVFLPIRKQVMDSYLNGRPLWRRGKGTTIGGRVTH